MTDRGCAARLKRKQRDLPMDYPESRSNVPPLHHLSEPTNWLVSYFGHAMIFELQSDGDLVVSTVHRRLLGSNVCFSS